ncbi:MAG: DUF4388 domain-containing protein [Deltaproteobacteria bacterium]|nr:DUF4388 domain-containing protein [Deltaproteobacteria bacterium]
MNLQGDFDGAFLTSILQLLYDGQNTGILRVTCGRKECEVIFQGGMITYARSSQAGSGLGALLARDGIISTEQLRDALPEAGTEENAVGRILLASRLITPEVLQEYDRKQVEEILYTILFWEKGKFAYRDEALDSAVPAVTQLNPMPLILEAARRMDEMAAGLIEPGPGENKGAGGPDISFILSIYTDILKTVVKTLAARSGERTNLLIRQARENLPPAQANLLQDFHLTSSAGVNRNAVTTACRKAAGDGMQQRLLLIDSFNGLCHHLLARTIPLVARDAIYDIIQEIDKVLEYVKKYPGSSMEKDKIISDMRNVLNDTIKQTRFAPGKTKERGFLSLFRKK